MFYGMWIGVGFQLELQLTFRYMIVDIKLRFMAMFNYATSSRKFVAKSRLCCSIHTLL
jgi:hypothetical protein